jgi:hypothetical protein
LSTSSILRPERASSPVAVLIAIMTYLGIILASARREPEPGLSSKHRMLGVQASILCWGRYPGIYSVHEARAVIQVAHRPETCPECPERILHLRRNNWCTPQIEVVFKKRKSQFKSACLKFGDLNGFPPCSAL